MQARILAATACPCGTLMASFPLATNCTCSDICRSWMTRLRQQALEGVSGFSLPLRYLYATDPLPRRYLYATKVYRPLTS